MSRRGLLLVLCVLAAAGLAVPPPAAADPAKPELRTDVPLWTRSTEATFSFTSDGTGFVCRLDGSAADLAPCTSPRSYSGLVEGGHSFQVRAVEGSDRSPPTSFSWTIDLTAPVLPGDLVAEATSPEGATVLFAASDNLDPAPVLQCTPSGPGSRFPLGTTVLDCTATDATGNTSPSGSIAVVVRDTTPPTVAPHQDVIREQQSAQGAVVDYSLPLALDAADASPVVACEPGPGSLFPLGSTQVTCRATDAANLTSAPVVFDVVVQQGPVPARPSLTAHVPRLTRSQAARFTFDLAPGLTAECGLDGPSGAGGLAPCASATSQSYRGLAQGSYLFTLRVTNGIGNVSQTTYAWTVDRTAPAAVAGFSARARDGRVRLRWTKPADLDYRLVRVWRKRVGAASWRRIAERRTDVSFTDRKVANETRYRYRIRSFDRAGNVSTAVEATARPSAVFAPRYDALLSSPPLVDWRTVRNATYYNLQLWRNGKKIGRKILSVWPLASRYRLRSDWRFRGRRYSLDSARYTVYVWPGFGPKAAVRYGPLLGSTSFSVR